MDCLCQFEELLGQELFIDHKGQGWARCPFCKSNKFAFNTKKQVWYCHYCKENGHILKLAMLLRCSQFAKGVEKCLTEI